MRLLILFLGLIGSTMACWHHGHCDSDEYCDSNWLCYECSSCSFHDDPIDGVCPPCASTDSYYYDWWWDNNNYYYYDYWCYDYYNGSAYDCTGSALGTVIVILLFVIFGAVFWFRLRQRRQAQTRIHAARPPVVHAVAQPMVGYAQQPVVYQQPAMVQQAYHQPQQPVVYQQQQQSTTTYNQQSTTSSSSSSSVVNNYSSNVVVEGTPVVGDNGKSDELAKELAESNAEAKMLQEKLLASAKANQAIQKEMLEAMKAMKASEERFNDMTREAERAAQAKAQAAAEEAKLKEEAAASGETTSANIMEQMSVISNRLAQSEADDRKRQMEMIKARKEMQKAQSRLAAAREKAEAEGQE